MTDFTKEGHYLIAENDIGGELYLFLDAKKDAPEHAKIVYDGKDHALFYRRDDDNIILDYIHPEIREKLRQAKEIMVVETILENIKTAYLTPLEIVDKLPIDTNSYGLTTWDALANSRKATQPA